MRWPVKKPLSSALVCNKKEYARASIRGGPGVHLPRCRFYLLRPRCQRRRWQPLQCSGLETPRDGGAWWAAVFGVAKSRTRLSGFTSLSCIGEGNGSPLQCSCLENPRDRGAWWAAVYGVARSLTRLKRLSSSSRVFPR